MVSVERTDDLRLIYEIASSEVAAIGDDANALKTEVQQIVTTQTLEKETFTAADMFNLCLVFTLQMSSAAADDFVEARTVMVTIISQIAQKPIDENTTAIVELFVGEIERQ